MKTTIKIVEKLRATRLYSLKKTIEYIVIEYRDYWIFKCKVELSIRGVEKIISSGPFSLTTKQRNTNGHRIKIQY